MIYLFSGTPGSGKSLHMANIIYWRLKYHKKTIGNFEINISNIPKAKAENYISISNDELSPELLRKIAKEYFKNHKFKEGSLALVIDECQLIFNAREWNAKGRSDWLGFFTNHRKYGYDIYLIAQFDRMIDRQIRSLIEYEFIHRKVGNFGIQGKLLSLASGGKLFVSVKMWYPLKERIGSDFFKATKKYYSIYDSYATFDNKDSVNGVKREDENKEHAKRVVSQSSTFTEWSVKLLQHKKHITCFLGKIKEVIKRDYVAKKGKA